MLAAAGLPAPQRDGDEPFAIALVNNMPDAALHTTERQFRELLSAASGDCPVALRLFSLPEVPRSEAGRSLVDQHYENFDALWDGRFDGLIVTGTVPRESDLTREPYWRTLARLVDWAEDHTISTVWSCLAAHAAVFHADGIARERFGQKLSGVFDCRKAEEHPLLDGLAPQWRVPHSRYNDVPEAALAAHGYRVLSWLDDAGADLFVREGRSLFVFVQGHPEYDPWTLLREYRRDVGVFLAGASDAYPELPRFYFDERATAALLSFREIALRIHEPDMLARFPDGAAEANLTHHWRPTALRLYGNWIAHLAAARGRARKTA